MNNKFLCLVVFIILQLQTSLYAENATTQTTSPTKEEKPTTAKDSARVSLTLEHLLDASKDIAEHKSSKRICPATGKVISINGTSYEVRFFFYEDVQGKLPKDTSFKDFAKSKDLLSQPAKVMDQGYGPVIFFSAPEKLSKEEGFFYLLAIRALNAS